MFRDATPPGTWQGGQPATLGRDHAFTFGFDVRWQDAPDASLIDATATFTAIAE
jgi:hypothetical protein